MGMSPTGLFLSELGAAAGAGVVIFGLVVSGVNWAKGCGFSLWANKKTVACRTLMESEAVRNAVDGAIKGQKVESFNINNGNIEPAQNNDGNATVGGFLDIDTSNLQGQALEKYSKLKAAVDKNYGSQLEALKTLQEKKSK